MKLCIASYKPVWRSPGTASGFASDGGFPAQIAAISSLFDHTELVVCERSAPPDSPGIPLPANGVRVVPVPMPPGADAARKLFMLGGGGYYLARMAAQVARADAVHVILPGDIGLMGMLLALAMRKPLFARFCTAWPNSARTTRASRLTKRLMMRCAGGRNVMFATGLGEEPPDGPGGRMHWIFTASMWEAELAELERGLGRGRSSDGPSAGPGGEAAGPCRLVYVGRLAPSKGILHLLEAQARLEREAAGMPEGVCHLTLVGHGPQLDELRQRVAALGLAGRVRFAGLLDRAGVYRELAQADLFVLPSLSESFGKVIVEAMAAGLPVVSTAVGVAPTLLGTDGRLGLVVPPGDVHALARAIGTLAAEPTRRQEIAAEAHGRVRCWTLEAWADQFRRILEEAWGLPLKGSADAQVPARARGSSSA
jgi:hypothetical protein